MSGPEHLTEGTLLLLDNPCSYSCPHSGCEHEQATIARAQAHFTAALAIATALRNHEGMFDRGEWVKASQPEAPAVKPVQDAA